MQEEINEHIEELLEELKDQVPEIYKYKKEIKEDLEYTMANGIAELTRQGMTDEDLVLPLALSGIGFFITGLLCAELPNSNYSKAKKENK